MVNVPCTLDYKVQKRTERNLVHVHVHKTTTGKMMAESLARIDHPMLNVKRRRLINILVVKEHHFIFKVDLFTNITILCFIVIKQAPITSIKWFTLVSTEIEGDSLSLARVQWEFRTPLERVSVRGDYLRQPQRMDEDPDFICHVLTLAQLQERKLDSSKPSVYTVSDSLPIHLLVTNVLDREYILCYEAQIITELFNELRNPKDATRPMKWSTIRRRKVSYKSCRTFAGRLVAGLVAPSPLPPPPPAGRWGPLQSDR
ncbi:hypothetical protein N7537_010496 [Penicillium hordei]|uniref:Uncharacterized protein n=1 Tax=Penicillium hordei TaxID=40994 RepID=A0AAD6DW81_9EURO|nr:uncharacterized protein N7537_010496 [Penicillium hordei]KAJ5593592.1 hypothetical protein N7537_010496 [Penicillium hordei]